MSIRPVDFQIMVPRTMDAAKASSNEAQRYISAQQQQTTATQNKAEDYTKLVHSQEQAQEVRISQKQKDNRSYNSKNKKKSNNEANTDLSENEIKISTIDIKI